MLNWLPDTSQGRMVGDYIATTWAGGKAFSVFALVLPLSGGLFRESIYAAEIGLSGLDSESTFRSSHRVHIPEPPPVRLAPLN